MAYRHFIGFFLLLAGSALIVSCDSAETDTSDGDLHVHFQSGFMETPVQVLINGQLVYDERVSTNYVLGFAGGGSFPIRKGTNAVEVRVGDDLIWKDLLIIRSPIYIGVSLNTGTSELDIIRWKEPFLYL